MTTETPCPRNRVKVTYGQNGAGPHAVTTTTTTGGPSVTYDYDANGAMTSRTDPSGNHTYGWDQQGRSTEITTSTGTSEHIYSHDGTRLLRREPNGTGGETTTVYVAGMELTLNADTTTAGKRILSHGGAQIALRTNQGLNWLLTDPAGHNSITVAAGTTATQRQRYLPYGELRTSANLGTDRGYLNKPLDASSGLIRTDHRFYDPNLSRFISPDPLLDPTRPQSLNGYAYSLGSPVSLSDPSGLFSVDSLLRQMRRDPWLTGRVTRTGLRTQRSVLRRSTIVRLEQARREQIRRSSPFRQSLPVGPAEVAAKRAEARGLSNDQVRRSGGPGPFFANALEQTGSRDDYPVRPTTPAPEPEESKGRGVVRVCPFYGCIELSYGPSSGLQARGALGVIIDPLSFDYTEEPLERRRTSEGSGGANLGPIGFGFQSTKRPDQESWDTEWSPFLSPNKPWQFGLGFGTIVWNP